MPSKADKTKDLVIQKLRRRKVWGTNHKSLNTIKRMGWKPHERKIVEQVVLELIKEGKLRWYNKSKKAVQLVSNGG